MRTLLKFLAQTSLVVLSAVAVSAALVYYMPHASLSAVAPTVDTDAAFIAAPKLAVTTNSLAQNTPTTNNSAPVGVNIAPMRAPKNAPEQFVKVADLGKFMKQARLVRGVRMDDLKAATGLTEQQLLNIEDGKTVPTPDIANELETVLQVEVRFR